MRLTKKYVGMKLLRLMVLAISCQAYDDTVYKEHVKKIVGGRTTTIRDYPYQVSILLKGNHNCGGCIISSEYILTAAHCMREDISTLSVRAGSSHRNTSGTIVPVKNGFVHPNYSNVTHEYDIAVIELSQPLTYSKRIRPIDLADEGDTFVEGSAATITGWGWTTPGGQRPDRLRVAVVPYINQFICKGIYKNKVTDNMFCAGVIEGGTDTCQGDSGGPIVIDNKLAGVVSWGYGCAEEDQPGVYSSVPRLRGFIREVTGL